MSETVTLRLETEEKSILAGASLRETLYRLPVTILLLGELGSGKTTMLQGLARALGIETPLTSPTFALEQRLSSPVVGEFIHIDLYRLSPAEAGAILLQSEGHRGVRAIEWADRLEGAEIEEATIDCSLREEGDARALTVDFRDMPLPSREQILAWQEEVQLPEHVRAHCEIVADFAATCAERLIHSSHVVRLVALRRAAEVHDLFRFLDFRPGGAPGGLPNVVTPALQELWGGIRSRFPGMNHEQACTAFLTQQGYPELGEIVSTHGLSLPLPERRTIEQRILYYADKRVLFDRVVSLEERFEDFRDRYEHGKTSEKGQIWHEEARATERLLFGDDVP